MSTYARYSPLLCVALALTALGADPPVKNAPADVKTEEQLARDLEEILKKQQLNSLNLKKAMEVFEGGAVSKTQKDLQIPSFTDPLQPIFQGEGPAKLHRELQQALARSALLESRDIRVEVLDGAVVKLTGIVGDERERKLAEGLIRKMPGVQNVQNRLELAGAAQLAVDEELLKSAGLKTEPADLLKFFHNRSLSDSARAKVEAAIRLLGSVSYREREETMQHLIGQGAKVLETLRAAMKDDDPEISGRAEKCLNRIRQDDVSAEVSAAAARLLGRRNPQGAVEALFAYLATAQAVGIADEVRDALVGLAQADDKANVVLVKALQDSLPLRRAIAAEVLCKAGVGAHKEAVRRLLQDADLQVRLRVARSLVFAGDAGAVPALIELLPRVSYDQAWQIDDVLFRIAEGKSPPMVSVGREEPVRTRCRDAWQAWWLKEGKNAGMARLTETPAELGHTMVVLLDEGRVVDLDKDNQPRWSVENLNLPLDAQVLSGDRVLVAEYSAQLVSERTIKGEILWKKSIPAPLVAQRLTNGHTFIATDAQLVEFDREDKEVVSITLDTGERIMKALKLPNNEIACLVSSGDQFSPLSARIVRLDSTGKEVNSFAVELGMRLFGGRIHMLPNGHVLVPHNGESKVVEYDSRGKAVWEVAIAQPIAAFRLPNGNTLITSMQPTRGAVEFNRAGTEVWSFRAPTRVTRAMRR